MFTFGRSAPSSTVRACRRCSSSTGPVSALTLGLISALPLFIAACSSKNSSLADTESAVAAKSAGSGTEIATANSPALSVEVTTPQTMRWDVKLQAHGPIMAWQEAIVGAEVAGQRLVDVLVDVADHVHKGQVLARFSRETISADEQAARASVVEADALFKEARANGDRFRKLKDSGAVSPQEAQRTLTAESTAQAKASLARAQLASQTFRLRQTQVLAPDDGLISSRTATVGAVGQIGQELFRIIRQGRLQWRAEVAAADLLEIHPGMSAQIKVPGLAQALSGNVRVVAPIVDGQTRCGIVFIDLPPTASNIGVSPGMYASGWLALRQGHGLTLPQTAVVLQNGFHYAFVVDGQVVHRTKVQVGRREGDRIEIVSGLRPDAIVAATGVGLLTDRDTVRIVASNDQTVRAAR